ncbi:acylphosphatase [Pseudothermotoga hypogea DSM 11164 = NBRC 106472]|uniref:Acylphosphatase n=2 Tax=Pseudothermotoga hypogea TaxID=57487 RepID=A0A0X1KNW8_9THEM|nr:MULTISPECIES: acylphosphatase [Pseudothermotoga]AJC72914.1 acylphosphatase [Pseudothermotoga hypogea DSM 11164 = NBRC 106472]MBC7122135.1 acylphosphatase [Pseudothermotoga sp.]MDI6862480.1 acylphosphatase [Pseudothermotoga sp.]
MKAVFVKVFGHVQGVGFRYFTYRVAKRLNVTGYVRNAEDGTVEIHAEGEEKILERFLDEVSRGPTMAIVTDVRVEEVPVQGFRSFDIVH